MNSPNRWCWWLVFKVFVVGLLTGVRQYLNFVQDYMISSNDLMWSSTTIKQEFWLKLGGIVIDYMQGIFTPIFVGFHPAVYENECPSIHGVRE